MDEGNSHLDTNNEILVQLEQMIEKNEGLWKCKVCGKTAANKTNLKHHAETHIEGVSHACHICSKTFPTRLYLRQHISGIHSELFSCDICGKSGMNRGAYRMHKMRNHKTLSVKQ
jgi:ribosomal protein L37AE/L43A